MSYVYIYIIEIRDTLNLLVFYSFLIHIDSWEEPIFSEAKIGLTNFGWNHSYIYIYIYTMNKK